LAADGLSKNFKKCALTAFEHHLLIVDHKSKRE
jgi:hypothetical protein